MEGCNCKPKTTMGAGSQEKLGEGQRIGAPPQGADLANTWISDF